MNDDSKSVDVSLVDDPVFKQLGRLQQLFAFGLAGIFSCLFFGYGIISVFSPEWFSATVSESGVVTYGVVISLSLIVFFVLVSLIYLYVMNNYFETARQDAKKRLQLLKAGAKT